MTLHVANEWRKSVGRNIATADRAELTPFYDFGMPDGARVILAWKDGAKRCEWFDTTDDAIAWLARIGFSKN